MPTLPDVLPITPFTRPVRGEVVIPGSKSLTNRALLLAALCDAPVLLTGALSSEDTELMAEALRRMGLVVTSDPAAGTVRVSRQPEAFNLGEADLFVGLAGTAARFLTALCAAAPRGVYRLDGVPQMRRRPMQGLIAALRQLGADIRCTGEEGFFPLEIRAFWAAGRTREHRRPREQPAAFGVAHGGATGASAGGNRAGGRRARAVRENDDALDGAIWPAPRRTPRRGGFRFGQYPALCAGRRPLCHRAGCHGGELLSRPAARGGRAADHCPACAAPTAVCRATLDSSRCCAPPAPKSPKRRADSEPASPAVRARRGVERDFNEFSDTFLTLAALAPLLGGPTRITGIAHTRKQETDRVAGMARELRKLGQEVVEEDGALTITPRPLVDGVEIETYGDHRFAMSFGILGCHDLQGDGRPWLSIRNPACCAKTFPHFFELLETVRQNSVGR
jgi:3-phosphoshikimate 1-carboxyvinyltransferase